MNSYEVWIGKKYGGHFKKPMLSRTKCEFNDWSILHLSNLLSFRIRYARKETFISRERFKIQEFKKKKLQFLAGLLESSSIIQHEVRRRIIYEFMIS